MKSGLLILAVCAASFQLLAADGPVKVIFDTDIGNDVDDVLALGMLNGLQSRGACQLLAVTTTRCDEDAGPFVDAIDTFYGHSNVPVGCIHGPPDPAPSKFLSLVETRDGGRWRYPHRLERSNDAPAAVPLLRRILAQQPDQSVVLVQVGYFSNLGSLLDSPADAFSPLSGRELARRRVRFLSVMAAAFTNVNHNGHFLEFNVLRDIPAARKVARLWPTPIVWSGAEIGLAIPYPAVSIERDYNYVPHHLLKDAYCAFMPPPHQRPTWDLTAALYAVFPERGYFGLSNAGSVTIENDGFSRFTETPGGRDRFLKIDAVQIARVREAFVQLCSQPPIQNGR